MPTYTKSVTATFQDPIDHVPVDYAHQAIAKLEEMVQAGKTDGILNMIDPNTIQRVWLDQTAIDEWYAFLNPLNEQYSVVILNKVISDI